MPGSALHDLRGRLHQEVSAESGLDTRRCFLDLSWGLFRTHGFPPAVREEGGPAPPRLPLSLGWFRIWCSKPPHRGPAGARIVVSSHPGRPAPLFLKLLPQGPLSLPSWAPLHLPPQRTESSGPSQGSLPCNSVSGSLVTHPFLHHIARSLPSGHFVPLSPRDTPVMAWAQVSLSQVHTGASSMPLVQT